MAAGRGTIPDTMRAARPLVALALAFAVTAGAADVLHRTFDQDTVGSPPPGFTFSAARLTRPGRWLVRADGTNRYLAHVAEPGSGEGFAMALADGVPPRDLRLSARVRLAAGARIGGVVWRYQDPDNFYAVALDLSAQEIALYRVSRGNRIRLEFEDDLELDPEAWHVVRVEHTDGRIRVALGGIGVMRARAREETAQDGRAGVWASGAASAWFDDLSAQQAVADRDR